MLCQHLHCDDGSMLGLVEDGPTYWGNELARRIIRRRGVLPGTRRRRAPLSMVMRYHEDAPTYAWVRVSAAKDGVIVLPLMPSASARARPIRQRVMRSSTNRHKRPNLRKPKLRAVTP